MKSVKKKSTLKKLSVQSFHTSLSEEDNETVQGASGWCGTDGPSTPQIPGQLLKYWRYTTFCTQGAYQDFGCNNRPAPGGQSACIGAPGALAPTCIVPIGPINWSNITTCVSALTQQNRRLLNAPTQWEGCPEPDPFTGG